MNRNELLIERHVVSRFPFSMRKTALAVIDETLLHESFPLSCQVSLLLAGEEEVRSLNSQFRGIDRTTDVLSFPNIPFQAGGDYRLLNKKASRMQYCDPESGLCCLGDVVISVPHCYRQAETYGHSVRREFAFLLAHSMLHLLGYDHMSREEEAVMIGKQEEVLNRIGIGR